MDERGRQVIDTELLQPALALLKAATISAVKPADPRVPVAVPGRLNELDGDRRIDIVDLKQRCCFATGLPPASVPKVTEWSE